MKIGILTFHEVFNPGAFLQALGTQKLLEGMGHDAHIINYNSPRHRYTTWKLVRTLSYRLPFRLPLVFKTRAKNNAFALDRSKYMHLSKYFESHAELEEEYFDVILVGADIVWNFELPYLGQDSAYFGHFLNTPRLVSFAPSVGACGIMDDLPDYVVSGLPKFHAISARDSKTQDLVERVLGSRPPVLCDPAFHLDLTLLLENIEWDNLPKEPYVLVYLMGQFCDDAFIDEIKVFARRRKLRIISTLYSNRWADEDRVTHGPMEWLQLIANAEHVITNTFHGTVFSIMMNKSFAVQYTPLIESKTKGMLASLDLDGRVIEGDSSLGMILGANWDFEAVAAKINEWKRSARSFIQNALTVSVQE